MLRAFAFIAGSFALIAGATKGNLIVAGIGVVVLLIAAGGGKK